MDDNELRELTVTLQAEAGLQGTFTLSLDGNATTEKLKIWYEDASHVWHQAQNTYTVTNLALPLQAYTRTFWLEGIAHSDDLRDLTITAQFTPNNNTPTPQTREDNGKSDGV